MPSVTVRFVAQTPFAFSEVNLSKLIIYQNSKDLVVETLDVRDTKNVLSVGHRYSTVCCPRSSRIACPHCNPRVLRKGSSRVPDAFAISTTFPAHSLCKNDCSRGRITSSSCEAFSGMIICC